MAAYGKGATEVAPLRKYRSGARDRTFKHSRARKPGTPLNWTTCVVWLQPCCNVSRLYATKRTNRRFQRSGEFSVPVDEPDLCYGYYPCMAYIPPPGNKFDYYTFNGTSDLAFIPAGIHPAQQQDAPVRLQRGDAGWGAIHIAKDHGHWLDINKMQVHEMVWKKLQHAGGIYSTEDVGKLKITLRISPSALLILRFIPKSNFYTVVSLYPYPNRLDGDHIGHYSGNGKQGPMPNLSLPISSAPVVTYKRIFKRKIMMSHSPLPSSPQTSSDDPPHQLQPRRWLWLQDCACGACALAGCVPHADADRPAGGHREQ